MIAVVALLAGCGPPKPPMPVDGWKVARAALVDGTSCYPVGRSTASPNPMLWTRRSSRHWIRTSTGKMPGFDKEVEKIIWHARSKYRTSLLSPAGLAKTEKLVAAYYDNPTVDATLVEGTVSVDAGALPGRLTVGGRVSTIMLSESDLVEGFRWKASEAGRKLARYATAHPGRRGHPHPDSHHERQRQEVCLPLLRERPTRRGRRT